MVAKDNTTLHQSGLIGSDSKLTDVKWYCKIVLDKDVMPARIIGFQLSTINIIVIIAGWLASWQHLFLENGLQAVHFSITS